MPDEPNTNPTTPAAEQGAPMSAEGYVAELKRLKDGSVDKALFDAQVKENETLRKALGDRTFQPAPAAPKETVNIAELRKEVFSGKPMTNLEWAQKFRKLDKALLETNYDIILQPARGRDGSVELPGPSRIQFAANFRDVLDQCIEQSQGDARRFTALWESRIAETPSYLNRR